MPRTRRRLAATSTLSLLAVSTIASVASAHGPAPVAEPAPRLERCPVDGPSEFTDSWGDARSGGRSHQGVDMAADRGTPVVAVRDGLAELKSSALGGNAIWLVTADGDRFYYAHLDGHEGASRPVAAGEVIGYVGSTGNANGDHLHFESHKGESPVNPYPAVRAACGVARDGVPGTPGTPGLAVLTPR